MVRLFKAGRSEQKGPLSGHCLSRGLGDVYKRQTYINLGLQWWAAKQANTHKESNMNALKGCKMQEPLGCSKGGEGVE